MESDAVDAVFGQLLAPISDHLSPSDILSARLACKRWRQLFAQSVTAVSVLVRSQEEAAPPAALLQHAQRLTLWLEESRLDTAALDPCLCLALHHAVKHLRIQCSTTLVLQYTLRNSNDVSKHMDAQALTEPCEQCFDV